MLDGKSVSILNTFSHLMFVSCALCRVFTEVETRDLSSPSKEDVEANEKSESGGGGANKLGQLVFKLR